MRLALALVSSAAMLMAQPVGADSNDQERVIRYDQDAVTVRLAKVPVTDVLNEIGRQAGANIRGQVRTPHDVSVEFEAVPMSDALHRLLGDQNFALVYGHDGELKSVRLLGGPQVGGPPPAPAPAPATPPLDPALAAAQSTPQGVSVLEALAKHGPVPVGGKLGEALGSQQASLFQLLDVGMHNPDTTVRAEASRAMMAAVDTDSALRTSVVTHMNTMDDAALAAFFRNAAGDQAEDVAMQVLSNARSGEIRNRVTAVLQRLRAGG